MKNTIRFAGVLCLFAGMLAAAPMAMAQNTATLPLVLPVTDGGRESFIRIVNLSGESGSVSIRAIDDTGERFGPVTIDLAANGATHFRSRDLEQGNAARGLSAGIGDGVGNWRLEFTSDLDFGASAYIRTSDGFLTSMHDKVPETAGTHHVIFFNPASNVSKQSRLRLVNPGTTAAEVTISACDDAGQNAPGGDISLTIPARESRTLTAQALEAGGEGFTGSFGDGTGKWRLFVTSSVAIEAMSLLSTATGHLANLSTVPFDASTDTCRQTTDPTEGCANDAAFDALVLGNRIVTDSTEIRFMEGNRIRETFPALNTSILGSYTYTKTGPNTGTMQIRYDNGVRCDVSLRCTSPTAGTLSSHCTFRSLPISVRNEEWRIIP